MINTVPKNNDGIETNTEDVVEFKSDDEAKSFFNLVKNRLFSISRWQSFAGSATAQFELTDSNGTPVSREPAKGDFFKIKIPAPGPEAGEGFDWVQVEEIVLEQNEEKEQAAIRVRPAPSPLNDAKDVAHFFSDEATSSFIVRREDNKVAAGVYGRNEKPNTDTETLKDKLRNAAVATGAISGFSKLQWKSLVSGLLKQD